MKERQWPKNDKKAWVLCQKNKKVMIQNKIGCVNNSFGRHNEKYLWDSM